MRPRTNIPPNEFPNHPQIALINLRNLWVIFLFFMSCRELPLTARC